METPAAAPLPAGPRWMLDVLRFLPLRSQFVLWGNIRDRFAWIGPGEHPVPLPLPEFLATHLGEAGVPHCLSWALGEGVRIVPRPGLDLDAERAFYAEHFGLQWPEGAEVLPLSSDAFFDLLQQVSRFRVEPVALVADLASRLVVRTDAISDAEQGQFTRALLLSLRAQPLPAHQDEAAEEANPAPRFNTIFWLADREGDLPDWLVVENPRLRSIAIPLPDQQIRRVVASALCRSLPGFADPDAPRTAEILEEFVDQTDHLRLSDLLGVVQLCLAEDLGFAGLPEGARRYRLGVTEDPWKQIDRERIRKADETVQRRVIGQDHAVIAMLDVVKRAVMGLSGTGKRSNRPRGVAFLAGPTGTGKTELAKTVTQLLFGDEQALIRFDMSEFSAPHADQRLLGAPPGYVGYDSGGELTNAIRERPFSVVLFDEIEKAHPSILDKFLQILDDGVLTSGRGERVYFSEAFIIFTSNLGIYRFTADGLREPNVTQQDGYETVAANVRLGIENYFKLELGRPEILNRLGENILVFDFIRPAVAEKIFASMLSRILTDLHEEVGVSVKLTDAALGELARACTADLANGGRGIRNQLEARFINPLARALFDGDYSSGDRCEVSRIAEEPTLPELTLKRL